MDAPVIAQRRADWDVVSEAVAEATELQRRVALAVKAADEEELATIRAISENVSALKKGLDGLVVEAPAHAGCDEEIALAIAEFTQKLYTALKQRLAPSEWPRVRDIVREVSGEEPS